MTNKAKARSAFAQFVGHTLTSKQVKAVMIAAGIPAGSALPSDYAGPNPKSGTIYADQLFNRVAGGYQVRPESDWIAKPSTGGSSESLEDALASARALIAKHEPVAAEPVAAELTEAELEQATAPAA